MKTIEQPVPGDLVLMHCGLHGTCEVSSGRLDGFCISASQWTALLVCVFRDPGSVKDWLVYAYSYEHQKFGWACWCSLDKKYDL